MADKPVDDLAKALDSLKLGGHFVPQSRWKDSDGDESIHNLSGDWQSVQKHWESLGVPCRQVAPDGSGTLRFQPRLWPSLQCSGMDHLKHEVDVEFIVMNRNVEGNEEPVPGQELLDQMSGGTLVEVAQLIVPRAEVAALEAQGWEVKYRPNLPFNPKKGFKDGRHRLMAPIDVVSTDKPTADSAYYLGFGMDFGARNCTKAKWSPGDLIGEGGSDPAAKALSASYATPDKWDKVTDSRSATSAGHCPHHERPNTVCLGWGGYDKFTHWQSCGRQIAKEMVEGDDITWSTDLLAPLNFLDESDKVDDTMPAAVKRANLPPRPANSKPKSMKEVVTGISRKPHLVGERSGAWAGTLSDEK